MRIDELLPVLVWNAWGRAIASSHELTALDFASLAPKIQVTARVTRATIELRRSSTEQLVFDLELQFAKKTNVEWEFLGASHSLRVPATEDVGHPDGPHTDRGGSVRLTTKALTFTLWQDGVTRIIPSVMSKSPFMSPALRYVDSGPIEKLAYGFDSELGLLREIDGDFKGKGNQSTFEHFTRLGLTCVDTADDDGKRLNQKEYELREDDHYESMVGKTRVVWTDEDGGRIEVHNSSLLHVRWGKRSPKYRGPSWSRSLDFSYGRR